MFITSTAHKRVPSSASQSEQVKTLNDTSDKAFTFNIKRLLVAAGLLIILLAFAIGTAFFEQLAQIHTMLLHAFELILGVVAGLLGGEVIAKSEKS